MYSPFSREVSNTMTRKNKNKKSAASSARTKTLTRSMKGLRLNKTPYSDVGAHLGGMLGFKDIGKGIGGVIGRILGSGDYSTNFNDVQGNQLTANVPSFGMEETIITHREYVQDIVSPNPGTNFSIQSFAINPANATLFPWLSQIASNYEEYSILGMVFEFKSMSGASVASTNTSLGSVIMATEYDPTKTTFVNKQQMENYFFAQSTVPSQSILHALECKTGSSPIKTLYTFGGAPSDIRFTTFGNFQIATVGIPGPNVTLGELWISYRIKLAKPRLIAGLPAGSGWKARGTLASSTSPLGSSRSFDVPNGGSLSVAAGNSNLVISNVGANQKLLFLFAWSGSNASVAEPGISINNGTLQQIWANNTRTAALGAFGVSTPHYSLAYVVKTGNTGPPNGILTFGFDGAGIYPTTGFVDIMVATLDNTMTP